MNIKRFNWQIWAGFVLSFLASLAYPFFFVNYPITRDFPWATLVLYALAVVLLLIGLRRAFAGDTKRPLLSKIVASGLAGLIISSDGVDQETYSKYRVQIMSVGAGGGIYLFL